VKFLRFLSFAYPASLRNRLLDTNLHAHDVCLLNFELGERFAEAVGAMKQLAEGDGVAVDFAASHGHTIAHIPPRDGQPFGTLQIGEAAIIAERTGLPVVSDFRARDVAAGGQGAPLVPYADWVMFARPERTVACLNIGGIANFTVVPPDFERVLAFDTGPGNMAIDGTVRLLTRGRDDMDNNGTAAASGEVIEELATYLLSHPYFDRVPPKSTGREEFGAEKYLRDALASRKTQSYENLVATVTSAVAASIADAFERFIRPEYRVARIIVSGGGARNRTLLEFIQRRLPDVPLWTSEQYGINSKAREALAFAILGNETICDTPSNVPLATGASHAVILGKITPA
jgi:anhydro-N-acetylmuramic acid kinase